MKDDGIHATNQDFIRYDQVEKKQVYHLAESSADDQFDDAFELKICDMRSDRFPFDLGEALREIGFAIVSGTGVDPELYDEAEAKVEDPRARTAIDDAFISAFRAVVWIGAALGVASAGCAAVLVRKEPRQPAPA